MPELACGSEAAGLVHEFVTYEELLLLHGGVPAGFGKGNAVLYFLEHLFDGSGMRPQGGSYFPHLVLSPSQRLFHT